MSLCSTKKGILYAFLGFNCFTLSDACVKWLGMENGYSVIDVLFWVYLTVLMICTLLALPQGVKKKLGTRKPLIHIARGGLMLLLSGCAITALSNGMSLATLYTIIFLSPVIITIAAIPIYKERVSRKSWQIILLGFAGIIVAFHKDISLFNSQIFYALGVLGAGVTTNILSRPIDKRDSLLTLPFYPAAIIVPSLFLYMHGQIPLPAIEHIPVFLLGGITLFFAIIGVAQGFRTAPFAKVAPTQYTQMISGIIIGYYLFSDVPGTLMLIGAGMIISSGLLLITQKR